MKTKLLFAMLFVCSFTFAQYPTNGLVAQYGFDNNLIDGATSVNLTQVGNQSSFVNNRFGTANNAMLMGGDHFTRGDVNISNNRFSISFWVKTTTNDNNPRVILNNDTRTNSGLNSNETGFHIWLQNGRVVGSTASNTGTTCSSTNFKVTASASSFIADGSWHHITIVLSENNNANLTIDVYQDGVHESVEHSVNNCFGHINSVGNVVLGNVRTENATHKYEDIIDDLLLYDRELTATEIANIANYNNYCFTPVTSTFSVSGISNNSANIDIAESGTFDVAYHNTNESFTNATIITGITSGSVSLNGLLESNNYQIYIRKNCSTGSISDWSPKRSFRTLGRIYVNQAATGLNDGSSWANAYNNLQDALAVDYDGSEIWVAGGAYKASVATASTAFMLNRPNVSLYGGFVGTETSLSQRVLGANPTILTGDFNNDDTNDLFNNASRSDNTRILVSIGIVSNITIDGFTLRDAQNNGSSGNGGAIYNTAATSNLVVRNCSFYRNGSSSTGSAIYVGSASSTTIESCDFEENFGVSGVVTAVSSLGEVTVLNVAKTQFSYNITTSSAGAILANYSGNNSVLTIDACEFKNNTSRSGGAIYVRANTSTSINVSLANSLFNANVTQDFSSLANSGSSAWLRAIGTNSAITSTIVNNTFVNNIDLGTANGLNNFSRATLVLSNSGTGSAHNATTGNNIFYYNTTTSFAIARSITGGHETLANVSVVNSIDEDNFSALPFANHTNTITANPIFTDAVNDDFTLQSNSPAIDIGDNSIVTWSADLLNNSRIFNTTVDIGAYEFGSASLSLDNKDVTFFKIYPNPTLSILNIESDESIKQIRIVDVLGKEILKTKGKTIDVSQLNQGMYLIEIEGDNNQTIIKRFIKK